MVRLAKSTTVIKKTKEMKIYLVVLLNVQKEDDVRVDERLSVHKKIDMFSPRHSRRRSRSRRHMIYVPSSPEGIKWDKKRYE